MAISHFTKFKLAQIPSSNNNKYKKIQIAVLFIVGDFMLYDVINAAVIFIAIF